MKKILIMGLPGSGKTMLATALKAYLESNSDVKHMPYPQPKSEGRWVCHD